MDQAEQDAPTCIVNGFSQTGAGQSLHIQSLNRYRLVLTDKMKGEFVVMIEAGLPDLPVVRSYPFARLGSVL